jgi:hypothetical protein
MWTLEEYLKPNEAIRSPTPSPDLWTSPSPSLGERHFKFSTKGSAHGVLILYDRCIEFESDLERKCILVVWARPDTLSIVEQSRVEFIDKDGVVHEHAFDMLVTTRAHKKIAIDVKPAAKVKSSGIRQLHRLIAPQMAGIADKLVVMTEKKFTAAAFHNAELFHAVTRQHYPEDDKRMLRLVRGMKAPARIEQLVSASGLDGYGFNAVVRLIASGELRLMAKNALIDDDTLVVAARTTRCGRRWFWSAKSRNRMPAPTGTRTACILGSSTGSSSTTWTGTARRPTISVTS